MHLHNGAKILNIDLYRADRNVLSGVVLAYTGDEYTPYVVWNAVDAVDGIATFNGHYFRDFADAFDDYNNRRGN